MGTIDPRGKRGPKRPSVETRLQRLRERIEAKVKWDEETDCWVWTGRLSAPGRQGRPHREGLIKTFDPIESNDLKRISVARASYMAYVGAIPEGMCVTRECANPLCINPEHLVLRTRSEHAQRKRKRRPIIKSDED